MNIQAPKPSNCIMTVNQDQPLTLQPCSKEIFQAFDAETLIEQSSTPYISSPSGPKRPYLGPLRLIQVEIDVHSHRTCLSEQDNNLTTPCLKRAEVNSYEEKVNHGYFSVFPRQRIDRRAYRRSLLISGTLHSRFGGLVENWQGSDIARSSNIVRNKRHAMQRKGNCELFRSPSVSESQLPWPGT